MAAADLPSPDPLTTLREALGAQYHIERLLGQGGMGAVYLARDTTLDRPVAIKVISPDVATNASLRERFLQEARAVARLRHPNIVPVYSAGEAGGIAYFAMEYVPGESLRELLIREKKLGGERAERLVREIALALHYAHAQGIIHRDIKPENILIDGESGRAMLTDFGVARAFEQEGGLTQTGMILGSPRYMAPEQASGEPTIDGRSDLYALALVAYEMHAGAPVVQSGTVASMLVKHLTETPARLVEKAPDVAPHVAAAIMRGLEKDPRKRWQTGHEFAEAIAGGALTPTGELRGTGITRAAHPATRVRPLVLATAVAAAVAVGFFAMRGAAGPTPSAYLVTPFEVQSGDQGVRWLREGSINMLTLTLGQWQDLNVINYERTLSLLDAAGLGDKERLSLEDARAVARRADAGTVVTGQVQTTRDSLIVVARLFDVRTGKALQQAQQGALLGDDPRPLFDRLAQTLLAIAGGPVAGVELSRATTTSLEAYRAYLDGVKLLNTWKLDQADDAFSRAIALDSTFALAYHKRALAIGWNDVESARSSTLAERAFALSDRLPPRERSLVEGYYHLTRGLGPKTEGRDGGADLARAISTYQSLIARDSLVAEAWYGMADAYFHARTPGMPVDSLVALTTRALRGFNRTLAIDSTLHLAYSHLVQVYNEAAVDGSRLLLAGDSLIALPGAAGSTSSSVTPLDAAQVAEMRNAARWQGIVISRAWARADGGSTQSIVQLAQSYLAAGMGDSSLAVLQNAVRAPGGDAHALRLTLLVQQVILGDTAVGATMQHILDRYTADTLRPLNFQQRFNGGSFLLTAAGAVGRSADIVRARELLVATDSIFPLSQMPTGPFMDVAARLLRVAMGEPMDAALRRDATTLFRSVSEMPAPMGPAIRQGSVSLPYLAFLSSRDSSYAQVVREWSGLRWAEIDALVAIERGDTATALRIARAFPSVDSLSSTTIRFGAGGLRQVGRAETLARLGMVREAAAHLALATAERVGSAGIGDPGFTVINRSLLTQARLWREVGERERAEAAYEEFLMRWRDADGIAAAQVSEARRELALLRDAARGAGE